MKNLFASVTVATGLFILFIPFAGSNQADDTTIRINGYTSGVTPFISNVSLTASDTTVLKEIQLKSFQSQASPAGRFQLLMPTTTS